jgi:hypothetical protein
MHILATKPIVAEHAHPLGDVGMGGRDRTSIAVGPKILPRVKAPSHGMTMCTNTAPAIQRAVRLSRGLNHWQPVFSCIRHDGIEVGRLLVKVRGLNRLSASHDGSLDPTHVEVHRD